jgi:sugar fermentation stimulation protein A
VLVPHRWPGRPLTARLIARPNRFLAVCKVGGKTVEAHVPDRGRCLDLLVPGRAVTLVAASGPLRRTHYTALLAKSGVGSWVSLDPAGAPRLVAEALRLGRLPTLAGLTAQRREIAVGSSRIDLLLEPGAVLCEVKSVGAARDGVALFPDAPTLRGLKHLALLTRLARRGKPAALVLCAQRGDVRAIAADADIDPVFARALRKAARAGVRVVGLRCSAHPAGMRVHDELPVLV